MNENIFRALEFAQGSIFRASFALLVLGLLRYAVLSLSDSVAAYMTAPARGTFWRKFWLRILWMLFPSVVLRRHGRAANTPMFAYHVVLCCLSLILRAGVIFVPIFMVAHLVLLERAFGLQWAALPGTLADTLAVITIVAGVLLFFGRLYSPMLRRVEPAWTFLKPLILIVPFITGFIAMHPLWSPLDYHFVMLLHVLSACAVMVMIPFGRLLSCMHTRLTDMVPETAWRPEVTLPASSHAEPARGS